MSSCHMIGCCTKNENVYGMVGTKKSMKKFEIEENVVEIEEFGNSGKVQQKQKSNFIEQVCVCV